MIVKILTLGRVRGEAIWDMVMLLCAALVLFKFHGSMGVHSVCVVILLAAMISRKYLLKDYWSMITTLSLWGVMLWKPHIGFLLGILPVVFHGHKFFNVITFCCLTSYFLEFFPVGPVLYTLVGGGAVFGASVGIALLNGRVREILRVSLVTACVMLTTREIIQSRNLKVDVPDQSSIPFGFRVGDTAARVANLQSDGPSRPIRSMLRGDEPTSGVGGIVLIEHDQWSKFPEIASVGNWHQKEPWNENLLLGNQFWLAAIRQDGQFQSNLGGQTTNSGRVFLMAPQQVSKGGALALEAKNTLYLADSDYFCNSMAPYQSALLGEILQSPQQYIRIRVASIALLLIGAVLPYSRRCGLGLIFVFALTLWSPDQKGDIRIIGNIFDSHEPSRASGVLAAMNEAGISAIKGDMNADILVVTESQSAHAKGEGLILLEPNSVLKMGSSTIVVDDLPMGTVGQILDARDLIVNGKRMGCLMTFDNVKVIGTGSPSKNIVELWRTH